MNWKISLWHRLAFYWRLKQMVRDDWRAHVEALAERDGRLLP